MSYFEKIRGWVFSTNTLLLLFIVFTGSILFLCPEASAAELSAYKLLGSDKVSTLIKFIFGLVAAFQIFELFQGLLAGDYKQLIIKAAIAGVSIYLAISYNDVLKAILG